MPSASEVEFADRVQPFRRELHVHCYRMLGSFDDAEDLLQETLIRAWRNLHTFDGGDGFRAWLYRIATNACLDAIRARKRRVQTTSSFAEVPWLQPYPDSLLDEVAAPGAQPDQLVVSRENIGLAYLAAVQLLPPVQRAVVILRDALGWSANETAALLDTTVPAANSALQRARATLQARLPDDPDEWTSVEPTAEQRELVMRLIDAHERCDAEAALALFREDIRITMPPMPYFYNGIAQVASLLRDAFGPKRHGEWRLVPVTANRQFAAASYLRRDGETDFTAFKLDLMRIVGGEIAELTTFGWSQFHRFGLPLVLVAADR